MPRSRLIAAAVCGILLSLATSPANPAQAATGDWLRFEALGQIGGSVSAVEVDGHTVYLGVGPRVVTLDVTDPSRPTPLGQSEVLPNIVQDLAVRAGHVYALVAPPAAPAASPPAVAAGGGGLVVLDASDPARPRQVGGLALPGEARRVVLAGSRAYVADGAVHGLSIVDITDPRAPRLLVRYTRRNLSPYDLAVVGDHIYLANGDNTIDGRCSGWHGTFGNGELAVLDAKDVAHLRHRRALWSGERVVADGQRLYGVGQDFDDDGSFQLQVMDTVDRDDPVPLGRLRLPFGVTRLLAEGDRLYVAGNFGFTVAVIDVSAPGTPQLVGEVNTGAETWDLAASGQLLFVASRRSGLKVVDVSDPKTPTVVGSYRPIGIVERLAAVGERVVTADSCAIRVVDAADPARPVAIADFRPIAADDETVATTAVAATTEAALVGLDRGDGGLVRVDLGGEGAPTFSRVLTGTGAVRSLAIVGSMAYVGTRGPVGTSGPARLLVADLTEPASARLLGAVEVSAPFERLVAGDGDLFALAAAPSAGAALPLQLTGVDVRDPAAPQPFQMDPRYHPEPLAPALARLGGQLVVGDGTAVTIVDTSDRLLPRWVATMDRAAWPLRAMGDYMLLANLPYRLLEAYDLSEPTQPLLRGSRPVPSTVADLAIAGERVYVAAAEGGLVILRAEAGPAGATLYLPNVASSRSGP